MKKYFLAVGESSRLAALHGSELPWEHRYWIELCDGSRFMLPPTASCISNLSIDVMARSLSRLPRYTGHSRRVISVAEHCIHGAEILLPIYGGTTAARFLLHEASEVVTNDINWPLKRYLDSGRLKDLADVITLGVFERHSVGLPTYDDLSILKDMDNAMLKMESSEHMPSKGHGWFTPDVPKRMMESKTRLLVEDDREYPAEFWELRFKELWESLNIGVQMRFEDD